MIRRRPRRGLADAARRILGHPREAGAILWARLTGKRLRARQRLAALVGIDHRLVLPRRILDRFPPASGGLGDGIRLIGNGTLVAGAPARIAEAFAADPSLQALYGDALVQARPGGPVLPLLLPVFDADRLAAFDDLGPVLAYRQTALDPDFRPLTPADAAFRIAERHGPRAIGHLPEILSIRCEDGDPLAPRAGRGPRLPLVGERGEAAAEGEGARTDEPLPEPPPHRRFAARTDDGVRAGLSPQAGRGGPVLQPERGEHHRAGEGGQIHHRVVEAHLYRTGRAGARIIVAPDGLLRVEHPLPDPPPLASLIVPTRDRLDLLRPCLDSLRACTDWPSVEILVCDNDSREPETLAYLIALEREGRGHVVPCPGPFNFAAMNNAAAARARGRLLVFVNNDVEAFRPDWLTLMAREALRPEVGAVGAKLLDGEGRIQHGGIVLGTGGLVTHGHRHFPGDAPGYRGALRATHAVSAVTAACLVVEADKFRAVGGFDDAAFAVDFNDVDLCLRLNAAGYRTLLVPEAVLHHREAASRRWTAEARARHAREIVALKTRWGPLLAQDPHYHPGFDPDLSTHARLRRDFPAAGPASVRRPPA